MWFAFLNVYFPLQSCGEHKESAILKHGFFAPSFVQDSNLLKTELEMKRTDKGESLVANTHVVYFNFNSLSFFLSLNSSFYF